jgi:hypothetical protein
MHQGCRPESLARFFISHFGLGKLARILTDHGQPRVRRMVISVVHLWQKPDDVGHGLVLLFDASPAWIAMQFTLAGER